MRTCRVRRVENDYVRLRMRAVSVWSEAVLYKFAALPSSESCNLRAAASSSACEESQPNRTSRLIEEVRHLETTPRKRIHGGHPKNISRR